MPSIRISKVDARNEPYFDRKGDKTRLFVSVESASLYDRLFSLNTPRVDGALLDEIVKVMAEKHPEVGVASVKQLHWSDRAGCEDCKCSPGFVVDGSTDWSVWIEVEGEAS